VEALLHNIRVGAPATTLGATLIVVETLKGFANRLTLSGFGRDLNFCPRVLATLEPWAEISERLRRFIQIQTDFLPHCHKPARCLVFKPTFRLARRKVMNKLMSGVLMLVLVLLPVRRAALGQQRLTDSSVVRIKTDIAKRLRDAKTNVTVRLRDGSELKGRITQAAENIFTLKAKNTQRDISYADVTKVKGNGLSKGAKFGILTGFIAGAVIIGALISLKNFDPFENGVLR